MRASQLWNRSQPRLALHVVAAIGALALAAVLLAQAWRRNGEPFWWLYFMAASIMAILLTRVAWNELRPALRLNRRKLLMQYANADSQERFRLRALYDEREPFGLTMALPRPADSAESLRLNLLAYSLLDQRPDWRDAMLWLHDLLAEAEAAGVAVAPILTEVAALSNQSADHWRMSTRDQLIAAAQMRSGGQ